MGLSACGTHRQKADRVEAKVSCPVLVRAAGATPSLRLKNPHFISGQKGVISQAEKMLTKSAFLCYNNFGHKGSRFGSALWRSL